MSVLLEQQAARFDAARSEAARFDAAGSDAAQHTG